MSDAKSDSSPTSWRRWHYGAAGVMLVAMFGLSFWAWQQLPVDARIAVHFGFDGVPDRWAGRAEGLLILPVIATVTAVVMALVPRIDPRGKNLKSDGDWYVLIVLVVLAVLACAHVAIIESALTGRARPAAFITLPLVVLCAALGRFLGRSRSNFFVGVRTPWTLSSDYAWQRANSLAGSGFLATGVVGLITLALAGGPCALKVLLGGMVVTAVVATLASYFFWRNDPGAVR